MEINQWIIMYYISLNKDLKVKRNLQMFKFIQQHMLLQWVFTQALVIPQYLKPRLANQHNPTKSLTDTDGSGQNNKWQTVAFLVESLTTISASSS